jgi:membrane fusion protein, multidrug efflux system
LLHWVTIGQYIESTDDAYVGGEVTTLSFKVAGLIETVAIVDNQSVKAGDLLLKLDDRDYRAQLARTEANIAARRAATANVDATRRMRVSLTKPGLTWPSQWLSGYAPKATSTAAERRAQAALESAER